MATQTLVFIDTCIWVDFFNRHNSVPKRAVDQLLDEDRAALIGPVLAEILLGIRKREEANWVASSLEGLHFSTVTWNDWRAAAQLGRELARKKHRLPLTDLALAAVAQRQQAAVYSTDPHFDLIPHLERFTPSP